MERRSSGRRDGRKYWKRSLKYYGSGVKLVTTQPAHNAKKSFPEEAAHQPRFYSTTFISGTIAAVLGTL